MLSEESWLRTKRSRSERETVRLGTRSLGRGPCKTARTPFDSEMSLQ